MFNQNNVGQQYFSIDANGQISVQLPLTGDANRVYEVRNR